MSLIELSLNNYAYTIKNLFKFSRIEISIKNIEFVSKNKILVVTDSLDFIFHVETSFDLEMLKGGGIPLTYISSFDNRRNLPIFFDFQSTKKNLFDFYNNTFFINYDILTISFIILSRIEEKWTNRRDEFQRFESKYSLASIYNFLNYPLVDEYANLFREYFSGLDFQNYVKPLCVKLIPTHDIDTIKRFKSTHYILRSILGDFASLSIRDILKIPVLLYRHFTGKIDQYTIALNELKDDSLKRGYTSKFFFMASDESKYDDGYNLVSIKTFIESLDSESICVHPSFFSYENTIMLKKECDRLFHVSRSYPLAARMHFLRFDISSTLKHFENCGLRFDYSLGYADNLGFRCGTANDYFLYDFDLDKPSLLKEFPLIAMDVTLFHYMKLSKNEAFNILCNHFEEVCRLGGNFVILWHNNYVNRKVDWYRDVYLRFLDYTFERLKKIEKNAF